jgi:hypothetical protein
MKTLHNNLCTGSAYLTVLIVVFMIGIYLTMIESTSTESGYMAQKLGDRMRAQCIAESGANAAYAMIKTNFYCWSNTACFPMTNNYGGGSYYVTVKNGTTSGAYAAEVVIYSTGTVSYTHGNTTNQITVSDVALSVANYPIGGGGSTNSGGGGSTWMSAFSNAVLTGGNMNFSGSGNFVTSGGVFWANGAIAKSGSGNVTCKELDCVGSVSVSGSASVNATNINIGGNLSISGSGAWNTKLLQCDVLTMSGSAAIQNPGNVICLTNSSGGGAKGTVITGSNCVVNPITIPNIDLTPYYNVAVANGQVYTNYSASGSSAITAPGGVIWSVGTITISGSGNINASLIATSDINISGSGNVSQTNGYPQLASQSGNISISGSQSFGSTTNPALIYTHTGTFGKSGSGNLIGQIISQGDVTASGSWSAFTYGTATPSTPGSGGSSGTNGTGYAVGIAGWQK